MVEVLSPQWEAEVKNRYAGLDRKQDDFTKTFFGRYELVDSNIENYLGNTPANPNVLCVGVGIRQINGRELSGTLPFEIAATLEGLDKDYRMTVLDVESRVLKMLDSADSISTEIPVDFSCDGHLDFSSRGWGQHPWNSLKRYLERTEQRIPNESELIQEIQRQDPYNYERAVKQIQEARFVRSGCKFVMSAQLPGTYNTKKSSGDVELVEGDVIASDLTKYGPFDFIHCLNILCHIPRDEKNSLYASRDPDILLLALKNMTDNLRENGILLVDTRHNDNSGFFVQTLSSLEKFFEGVSIDKVVSDTSKFAYVFARKK